MMYKKIFIVLVLLLPLQCFAGGGTTYNDFCKSNIDNSSKACLNTDKSGNHILEKDGEIFQDYVTIYEFLYSQDGSSFSFVAKNKYGDYVLMKDGKRIHPEKMYKFSRMSDLQYVGNSNTVAYKLQNVDEHSYAVGYTIYNNETRKGFYDCSRLDLYYGKNEEEFSYICQKNSKDTLYINKGSNTYAYENVGEFSYSPNRKSYAFTRINNDGSESLIVNGFEMKNGNQQNCNGNYCSKSIYNFLFSDDGQYFAYEKNYLGERKVFINGLLIEGIMLYTNGDFFKYNKEKYLQEINKLKENVNDDDLINKIDRVIRTTPNQKLQTLRNKLLKINTSKIKYSKQKYILEYLSVQIENKLLKLEK